MASRKLTVIHGDTTFDVEYNTADGLEVFKFQLFSLTLLPPDEQKIVRSDDNTEVVEDSDLISCFDKLKLVSIDDQVSTEPESSTSTSQIGQDILLTDEALARMLQAEEDALLFQQYLVGENKKEVEQRIHPYIDQVMMYEDPSYQEAARKTVPIVELEEKALVAIAKKEGNFEPSKAEQDHAFLLELLFWFKQSFSWVNAPPCDGCGNQTQHQSMGVAVAEEIQWGGSRVELFRCSSCSRITRFPRYNHPMKLLETRKGRCGEWANCFTFYCRAFGYDSRLILDFTDHVWTECYSNHLGRWMHLDPCEGIYDNPLLYERGWNKKLNYVFGISKDGIRDVTKRYTRKWHEVLTRRNLTTEPVLSSTIANLTKQCRRDYKPELIAMLEARDKSEEEALERALHSKDDAAISLPGRLSGDKQWRISRSEYGSGDSNTLSTSYCPIRLCVDEHVTKIYDAFDMIMSQFVDSSFSVPQRVDVLKSFKETLMDLKKSPFRSRRTTIKNLDDEKAFLCHMLPAFNALLCALHLSRDATNGDMVLSLAGDPVKTSLALPVAFDALDEMINSLDKCSSIRRDFLSPFRLNRIHSGSVLASGEELPFGIATSAFDGLRLSKWEEPNGAKGGWIAYKLKDEQACELVGYELMSANDAPERDPMDWIVEGSNDEGSNWHILDKRTSQIFETRFQRKMYKIEHSNTMSNVIRFKFLAVRDVQSTSRLQIGSIDLYARKN